LAQNRTLSAAVGVRISGGGPPVPNNPGDLQTATELFDQIPVSRGGSAEIGGVWASERNALIQEVGAQIVTFQTANPLPAIDGVIDRDGATLRLMNSLAGSAPRPSGGVDATVAAAPGGLSENVDSRDYLAAPNSLIGMRPLESTIGSYKMVRKLVRVDGSSIKWFGVATGSKTTGSCTPHVHFTPTPIQGHYYDNAYDTFESWSKLWDDYTSMIGGQMCASGVNQCLVIPFYQTAQQRNLGSFLSNWREVLVAVLTSAFNDIDSSLLSGDFELDNIVSSSFSNGWVAHQQFNTQAVGANSQTTTVFDLDGQAGGSMWRPSNGVIYLNKPSPANVNPMGTSWYVGGRWQNFARYYPGGMNTHACCRNHLLYHGLMTYCRSDIDFL
jgi:hypothetical protein